jgi:hypothetical protein
MKMSPDYAAMSKEELMRRYYDEPGSVALNVLIERLKKKLGGFLEDLLVKQAAAEEMLDRWWPNSVCPPGDTPARFVAKQLLDEVWHEISESKRENRNRWRPPFSVVTYLWALASHKVYVRMIQPPEKTG